MAKLICPTTQMEIPTDSLDRGDLQSILAVYGTDFVPGAILVDSVELYDYLTQLQGELALL